MDQGFVKEMKAVLEKSRTALLTELKAAEQLNQKGEVGHFPDYGDKEDENAAEVATFSDNLSLIKRLQDSLEDVEGALQRIEQGSYGICKYCHQPIDIQRLRARPESSSCIACKKKLLNQA